MEKLIRIVDYKQALFYADNGVQPIRIERGRENKLVFVYDKESTREVYGLWGIRCKEYRATHPKVE